MSIVSSSYANAESEQTADNILNPSLINENTVNTQNQVETVDNNSTGTQNTAQDTSSATQDTDDISKTSTTQAQETTQDTKTVTSSIDNQNSINTQANTQNAAIAASDVNQDSINSTSTNAVAPQGTVNTDEDSQAAAGETYTNIQGIWLKAEDAGNITVSELKNANITDIFVKTNLISTPTYQTILGNLINKFQNSGIRIHAWITCFKDVNGNWIDPANTTQRTFLLNSITNIVKNYNINGIFLDYVRYSGVGDNAAYKHSDATTTITSFVSDVKNVILANKPKVAISAALMPEGANNAYYYGQDYGKLANYLDFLVPMIYKGNYGQDTAWIGSVTKYIVDQAGGKPVIAGLQTYVSDYDTTNLPASELNTDIQSATDNGASGYALFRYGMINQDFLNPPSFTISEIKDAAVRIKAYVDSNHRLPNYVTIASSQISMSEFLKLMTKGLIQLNSGITTPITLKNVQAPADSTGTFTTGSIKTAEYLDIANRINAFIDLNGQAPSYATTTLGKISYGSLVYMFAKVFNFYNTNNRLPGYVTMDPAVKVSPPLVSELTIPTFSFDQIKSAATSVKSYIETNHALPNYVTIGTSQISMTDFLRLLLIGTIEINDGVKAPISLKTVNGPATPTESITNGTIDQTGYIDLAKRVKAFIDANGKIPNHATTTIGEIKFESLVYMYSKILSFYNTNSRLPSYVSVDPWSKVSAPVSSPVPSDLQKYLVASANCQVNSASINALAWSLAQGGNGLTEATKIFNWVRDNIGYSFYYNTKYGAVGTLNAGTGNCVDTSHLLIALLRATGIPARYEHVNAQFSSGSWYGHVVAQVYVNGKWYTADATSSRNTFGVVNNWNTATATIKGTYASLPF